LPTFFVGAELAQGDGWMTGKALDPSLEAELAAVADRLGCELVHAQFKGGVLRLYVDREPGISVEDCALISRQVSPLLDAAGFGAGRYVLEVSSPGLDRQLHRPSDYQRFVGRLARVSFTDPATARKRTVIGRLVAFRPETGGEVEIEASDTGETHRVALNSIQTARLEVEL